MIDAIKKSFFPQGFLDLSKYKIATDTIMQIIDNRFPSKEQFTPSPDITLHSVYSSIDIDRVLESFVFLQLSDHLNSKITRHEDLKFMQYLDSNEKKNVVHLINQKMSNPEDPLKNNLCNTINKISDLDLLNELSSEALSALFIQMKQQGKKIIIPESFNENDESINEHVLIHLINNKRVVYIKVLPQLLDIVEPHSALNAKSLLQALDDINFKKAPNVIAHLADILNNIDEQDALFLRDEIK